MAYEVIRRMISEMPPERFEQLLLGLPEETLQNVLRRLPKEQLQQALGINSDGTPSTHKEGMQR